MSKVFNLNKFWLSVEPLMLRNADKHIFDYIPPQKTNQIFTPKWVVRKMVDLLEQKNPHVFEDPEKTFADLYMKSSNFRQVDTVPYAKEGRMEELTKKELGI